MPALVAAITVVGTLVGTLGGVWLTQRGDRHRRTHELDLKALELEHDHRERLHSDRLTAYAAFSRSFIEHRRAHEEMGLRFAHRQHVAAEIAGAERVDEVVRQFDAAEARFRDATDRAVSAQRGLEDALADVELVASKGVHDIARTTAQRANEVWDARREFAGTPSSDPTSMDRWTSLRDAERRLEADRELLRVAIRLELGLAHAAALLTRRARSDTFVPCRRAP